MTPGTLRLAGKPIVRDGLSGNPQIGDIVVVGFGA